MNIIFGYYCTEVLELTEVLEFTVALYWVLLVTVSELEDETVEVDGYDIVRDLVSG